MHNAKLLGFTPDGGPIVRLAGLTPPADRRGSVLSIGSDGAVIVAFEKSEDSSEPQTSGVPDATSREPLAGTSHSDA